MKNTTEYASEAWVAAHFGNKFISAQEVGLGKLQIPFTVDELKYDKISWLIPLERNGVVAYHLVQGRYNKNDFEKNDTLSLQEAEKVIKITRKAGRSFPNNEKLRFLKTGEIFLADGIEYSKTIVIDEKSYSVINLPTNVSVVIIGQESKAYSYVSNVVGGIAISLDVSDCLKNREELYGSSVMTLVDLVPSQ
jgi:hypothetical protein